MTLSDKYTLRASLICLFFVSAGCRHQAVTSNVPTTTPMPAEIVCLQRDQVNTVGWDRAWTNLLNEAEESFIPSASKLRAVEVELVVANPGDPDDELTLTILDANGQDVAAVTQRVQAKNCDRVKFVLPMNGVDLSLGQTYWLRLSGGVTFGWKYVVGGYEKGEATFNGKPLLAQTRSTFLFRTLGEK